MSGPTTRSPLREKPLRNPGQSIDERINDLLFDRLIPVLLFPVVAIVFAVIEWWRAYHPVPPAPWPLTILAMTFAGVSWWKVRPLFKELRALKQGRDGEKVVGQQLEELRRKGCHILHDIPGSRGNIDHAIVALSGVYVIETKTYSKPIGRDARVLFNGTSILVDGRDRGPELLSQVAAERDELKRLFKELTGKDIPVRSVIVFTGWFVDTAGDWRQSGVWVLNPRMLPAFLDHEKPVLTPDEVALVHLSLATYVRQHEQYLP